MNQRFNPHTIRVGLINNFSFSWINENNSIANGCKLYLKNEISGISFNTTLCDIKIKLQKILGKYQYKKIINKVKKLSR